MQLEAEFTTEPFHGESDDPPAHALAAVRSARQAGLQTDFGPLGTAVRGEPEQVLGSLHSIMRSALDAGASRITVQIQVADDMADSSADLP